VSGTTSAAWIATNGDFNTAGNWQETVTGGLIVHAVPAAGTNATIPGAANSFYTVTFASGADTVNTLNTTYTELAMSGGVLALAFNSSLSNSTNEAVVQSGGLLRFDNGLSLNQLSNVSAAGGAIAQTGGTIQVEAGILDVSGNSSFAGTITGGATPLTGGALNLDGAATFTFNPGVVLTIGTINVEENVNVLLKTNLTDPGAYEGGNSGTLFLGGNTFTLNDSTTPTDTLQHLTTGGTIDNEAGLALANNALDNGAVLNNTGVLSFEDTPYTLGTGGIASATLNNQTTGTIEFIDGGIINTSGAATIVNAGLILAAGSGNGDQITANIANTGSIIAETGNTFEFDGALSNTGTLGGGGTILNRLGVFTLGAGSVLNSITYSIQQSATTSLATSLAYAGNLLIGGAEMNLNGNNFAVSGSVVFGGTFMALVNGPGTFTTSGAGSVSGSLTQGLQVAGGAALVNTGTMNAGGSVLVGDTSSTVSTITNTADGVWNFTTGNNINVGSNLGSSFNNAGLFQSNGHDNVTVASAFNNTGTVADVYAGTTLTFQGGGVFGGVLTGAGSIIYSGSFGDGGGLGNGTGYTLAAGAVLSIPTLGIYSTNLTTTGSETFAGTLTINGPFNQALIVAGGTTNLQGAVEGSGSLETETGTGLVLGGTVTSGVAVQFVGASSLTLGDVAGFAGAITGFASGDTIDLAGAGSVGTSVASATQGLLTIGSQTLTVGGNYAGLTLGTKSDGNGGTDVSLATAGVASATLPNVSASFTAAVETQLLAAVAAVAASGAPVNAVSIPAGGSVGSPASGALNAEVVTSAGAGSSTTETSGFRAGYLLNEAATLQDTGGGAVLISTATGGSLVGTASDTLFGGNAGGTLFATTGAETLIGGTGANAFFLGASTAFVQSQGNDSLVGSSGADTINASGSALYFGSIGATTFNDIGTGGDTVLGGASGNTVTGGGGTQIVFGDSSLVYTGGSGQASIVGGSGGNTVTGGSGNLVIFAGSTLSFVGTGGEATIIGGTGPLNAYLGTGGGVVFGSANGNDTLSSGTGLSIMVGGGNGDLLVATGTANDTLAAGGGAETLYGAASSAGDLVLFGGTGNDVLVGGTGGNVFIAGSANETMTGGGTSDSYVFAAATAPRTDVITNFNPNADAIGLFGYGAEPGADQAALASATSSGGNTVVSLTDGTTLVLTGAPTLNAYNFF
jgi:Ca2+-binding RTX toxin-like protein